MDVVHNFLLLRAAGMLLPDTWNKAATAASAAAVVAGLSYLWKKQRQHGRQAPGPLEWPIIGHAPAMLRPDLHLCLTKVCSNGAQH
eukprot:1149435-Pelagomonas_calceolata.AAC.2